MTTMLETLNETTAAYTSKTRAVDATGSCRFLTPAGRMCAIGRCMLDPNSWVGAAIDFTLKPEYRGYPVGFWADLRVLHDTTRFWDEEGLSDEGIDYIELQPILSAVKHGRELP